VHPTLKVEFLRWCLRACGVVLFCCLLLALLWLGVHPTLKGGGSLGVLPKGSNENNPRQSPPPSMVEVLM
jgi:hypothetical protein